MQLLTATHDTALYGNDTKAAAHFNSVDAFINYAGQKEYSFSFDADRDWTANTSGKAMVKRINALDMPANIMKKLNADIELDDIEGLQSYETTPAVVFCEDGFMCDTVAFYAGEEDCMLNFDDVVQPTKTVWLASDIISCATVSADEMTNRGVALIRAVKALQASGFNVGLVAYIHGKNSGKKTLTSIVVKRPDEALNETLIAAAFAHPSFFRTLGHNCVARLNNDNSGGMTDLPAPTREQFKDSFVEADKLHVLKGCFNYSDCTTPESAEKWIKGQLASILLQIEIDQLEAA